MRLVFPMLFLFIPILTTSFFSWLFGSLVLQRMLLLLELRVLALALNIR